MDQQIVKIPKGHIKHDVDGAPYKIGDIVIVLNGIDDTFNNRFKGLLGQVDHFDYSCGCGQTFPDDPMIGVRFEGGSVEEFWHEELFKLKLAKPRSHVPKSLAGRRPVRRGQPYSQ